MRVSHTPSIAWHGLLTDLQRPPAMVAATAGAPPMSVTWGFSVPGTQTNATQDSWRTLGSHGSAAFDSGTVKDNRQHANIYVPECDACVLSWRVCVRASNGASGCSPKQHIFTAPAAFHDVKPMWAPDNATKAGPQFAFFRATLPREPSMPVSALVFITADGPGCENAADKANRKLLGGYKLWVGDAIVGIGPGRSKCDTLGAARAPVLCPNGVETIYDGYDITAQLAFCAADAKYDGGDGRCHLFIESYGFDQPAFNISRRVMVSVRLRYANGTSPLDAPAAQTYDADAIYLGRLWGGEGNPRR